MQVIEKDEKDRKVEKHKKGKRRRNAWLQCVYIYIYMCVSRLYESMPERAIHQSGTNNAKLKDRLGSNLFNNIITVSRISMELGSEISAQS